MIRRLLALLAATALALAPAPARAPAPVAAHPALWKVTRAEATLYLFGTIHVLPAGYRWRDPAIDRAVADARALVLETVLDEDPGRVGRALVALGRAEGLPPVIQRVPRTRRASLLALIKASDVPVATLDGLKSWAAAIVLTGPALARIGVPAGGGVEPQLTQSFRATGRAVEGLETPEQQLGFFDALPEVAQRAFLAETVDSPARTRADFAAMLRAWSRGDVPAIARAFAEDAEFTPALRALLVKRRNALWAEALARRMARPGTAFVAVGAGHLAGPDSLQTMLAARGLTAVRVR